MKYLFIIALFTLSLISNEAIRVDNEYKVDLYYANSILIVYSLPSIKSVHRVH